MIIGVLSWLSHCQSEYQELWFQLATCLDKVKPTAGLLGGSGETRPNLYRKPRQGHQRPHRKLSKFSKATRDVVPLRMILRRN